jgi:hypothetical protein
MDLQAQDRAHRIGQTRPVLIYRLVSAHTVETKILQKAGNKRKLEALVISQGKFGRVVDENGKVLLGRGKTKNESVAEMAKALLDLEGEEINVASAGDTIIRLVHTVGRENALTGVVTPTWICCWIGRKRHMRGRRDGRLDLEKRAQRGRSGLRRGRTRLSR